MAARNSASLPGREASPRSPAAQSPGGALNSTWTRPFAFSHADNCCAGNSYGNKYSTPVKPSLAAAAKRSGKAYSPYMKLRFAAKRSIGRSLPGGAKLLAQLMDLLRRERLGLAAGQQP